METSLIAAFWGAKLFYLVPLVVAISLVYGATRHEYIPEILNQSLKSAIWVTTFMAIIFLVIFLAGWGV